MRRRKQPPLGRTIVFDRQGKRRVTRRKRSSPQLLEPQNTYTPIRYEIDTPYGKLVCNYDLSTALTIDSDGNQIAAIIKTIGDRLDKELDTSLESADFAAKVEAYAQEKGIPRNQAVEELKDLHHVCLQLAKGNAWQEFVSGLGLAISNAVSQQLEMAIVVAKIQSGQLTPDLSLVADKIVKLVKQQVDQRIQSPHIGGGPMVSLSWYYYVHLGDWHEAKEIYKHPKDSSNWRETIKKQFPHLPYDLIEWLAFSEDKRRAGRDIDLKSDGFQKLCASAYQRLAYRIKRESYKLSIPSDIALEHAARLCGYPEYKLSISRLRNIRNEQFEEAERTGVFEYLKNTQSKSLKYIRSLKNKTNKD